MTPTFKTWRKSTRSNGGSDCVEVGASTDHTVIGVRDSKDRTVPPLHATPAEWQALCKLASELQ